METLKRPAIVDVARFLEATVRVKWPVLPIALSHANLVLSVVRTIMVIDSYLTLKLGL